MQNAGPIPSTHRRKRHKPSVSIPRPIHSALFIAMLNLVLILGGCARRDSPGSVTISSVKVYTEDQVIKTFSEQRKSLQRLNNGIKRKELHELLGVQQAMQLDLNIAAQPTATSAGSNTGGTGNAASTNTTSSVTAPSPISGNTLTLPALPSSSQIGRPHSELLRDAITREQDIAGYDLLYLGDSQFFDDDYVAALIRLDVSINRYYRRWWPFRGLKRFLRVDFEVTDKNDESKDSNGNQIKVYYLSPEYSALIAQESLASSFIENYAAQIGQMMSGVDVQGSGRIQRRLNETFMTLVNQPLQYAIYGNQPNEFSFAFGPRRKINKRGVLNPVRWFGQNYTFDYEIEPGVRDCYALMLIPRCMAGQPLTVKAWVAEKPASERKVQSPETPEQPAAKFVLAPLSPQCAASSSGGPSSMSTTSSSTSSKYVTPKEVYPRLTTTLMVRDDRRVTGDSEVLIGPVLIPSERVTLLGRHDLKVTIPPNAHLKALIKSAPSQMVYVSTPGKGARSIQTITLKESKAPPKKPLYKVDPARGKARETIVITINDSKVDLSKVTVTGVTIGGEHVKVGHKLRQNKKKKHIEVVVPDLAQTVKRPVRAQIDVHYTDANGTSFYFPIRRGFTYE